MGRVVNRTKTGKRVKHGTRGAYTNHGCRCALCTAAMREAHREYLHRTGRRRPMDVWEADRPKAPHGGVEMYYRRGCRCDVCVEGTRVRRAEARRKAYARPTPSHVHGTSNGYDNHGCRCEACKAAKRDYRRDLRTRKARRK